MSLTFALAKGRLAKKTMKILEELNIYCSEMTEESRKLVFVSDDKAYNFFLSKPSDVPTFVEHGVADLGIVGKDTLLEENKDVFEVFDLNFGNCRMMIAGSPKNKDLLYSNQLIRVATKYPNIASKYSEEINKPVENIKLNGSVELGPIVGLSDFIVDIVESGKTLEENGLIVFDEICPLSARVIANKASIKVKHEEIKDILSKIEEVLK